MDLNTIEEIVRPRYRSAIPSHRAGDAFLAGGTWLFSEPQTHLRRLVDLTCLGWPALVHTPAGLHISATCPLAVLEAFEPPASWLAAPIIRQCCRALLGSFKIRRAATVGGNLCLALPASPMAALACALDGTCTIWSPDGGERTLPASQLIIDAQRTDLAEAEILRAVMLPHTALRRPASLRQMSLTPLGRSAALLIGTRNGHGLQLTITASTPRPISLDFDTIPSASDVATAIDDAVTHWVDDVHGSPAWRRRITHLMAADICAELAP